MSPVNELAPELEWQEFDRSFNWRQGEHLLMVGPAGSGKTVAARTIASTRRYVLVLGTKLRDPEMDTYIEEGFRRVPAFPTPEILDWRNRIRPTDDAGNFHFVLWPEMRSRADLRGSRSRFAAALDYVLAKGGWTVVADEGLWLSDRNGLNLGPHLEALAYTGRSSGVSLVMVVQRPTGVPLHTWTNCSHAFVWHCGNPEDVRKLASLGTNDERAVRDSVRELRGHQFLYLPVRSGPEWAVSEVEL